MKLKNKILAYFLALPFAFISFDATAQNLDYWYGAPIMTALDSNSDQIIDGEEINAAPTALLTMDSDQDGAISESELGGPGSFPGWVRLQTAVRVIDLNADMSFSSEEIEGSVDQLKRLDIDEDGKLVIGELLDATIVRRPGSGEYGAVSMSGAGDGYGASGPQRPMNRQGMDPEQMRERMNRQSINPEQMRERMNQQGMNRQGMDGMREQMRELMNQPGMTRERMREIMMERRNQSGMNRGDMARGVMSERLQGLPEEVRESLMEEFARFRQLPGGVIEGSLAVLLNNPEVTDAILPGEDERAYAGYTIFSEANVASDLQMASDAYLLDPKGEVVHKWEHNRDGMPEGSGSYLLDNGLLLRNTAPDDWLMMDHFEVGAHGGVQLVDWDGTVLWEYIRCEIGKYSLHHDMEPLPNGNILVTSYEAFSAEEVRAMGWDPTKTRTQINAGQGPNAAPPETVWMEKILELKPNLDNGSTEIVWEWNSWDHLVQSVDPDKPNYGVVKDEPGKIDLNFRAMQARQLHFNSIDYDPETQQILLSSLMFGEVWVLDHSTTNAEAATDKGGNHGKGGDLIYRWGMPAAYDSGPVSDRQLVGQHDARWIRGLPGKGDITVHNNVAGVVEGVVGKTIFQVGSRYSSIVEIDTGMNEDGSYNKEPGKPFKGERTWTFTAEPKNSWYSPFMGGATRLPNGNTLIINSHNKRMIEVTREGERVLDYKFPGLGRMFRVYKLEPDHPGLAGRL